MSAMIRDLWPDDLATQDVLSPWDILSEQAEFLTARMNNVLVGQVQKSNLDDRVVIGFEIVAPKIDKTIRVFAVEHRIENPYPAHFLSELSPLPTYLQPFRILPEVPERVVPNLMDEVMGKPRTVPGTPARKIENPWVASTPSEFTQKLRELLASPEVKAVIFSLLAQSKSPSSNDGHV